jgi:hypothetical protein
MISSNSIAADSASECFDRLANKPLPFEIYGGYGHKVFFQPIGDRFGLSDKGIPFIPDANALGIDEIGVAPLCNGNYVTIRKYSHHNFPIRLTGRVIGSDYTPLGDDFLISDSEFSDERQLSVATIYPKGFVVVWLASDKPTRKSTMVKARLFDQSGKPLGRSFNISTPSRLIGNAMVRGLCNGGFVVVWYRFEEGAYFRVFDVNGRPKTNEVAAGEFLPDRSKEVRPKGRVAPPRPCRPLLWISTTKEGVIDVFMNCYLRNPDKTSPFDFAQRFDSNGRSLTGKLTGLEMQNLPSYKLALDQYVKDRAEQLKVFPLHDSQRSTEEQPSCIDYYSSLVIAAETKHMTADPRLRRFFTDYCQAIQRNCHITQKYVENKIEECLRED